MQAEHWLAMPEQIRKQLAKWQENPETARLLTVDFLTQYTGERVFGFTVTNPDMPLSDKTAIWVSVPHAHEPAGTAACMNAIHQLLTGTDLAGKATGRDIRTILDTCLVTFLPDANPGGRCWAPVLWWDGTKYTNDEFWQWMRGVDPETGGMWQRVDRWRLSETTPRRRGIVYEQLNADEFVEPNRDSGSSFLRLFHQLDERYRYECFLDLHQTEFESSSFNCTHLLPIDFDRRTASQQEQVIQLTENVRLAWVALGDLARPEPAARSFPYAGDADTVKWFRSTWGEIDTRMPRLTVEVQNNSTTTPPEAQLQLSETAIWTILETFANARVGGNIQVY